MTPLEKFRQQVAIAKASAAGDLKSYVVQTADEAQALLDEIDGKRRRLPTAADVRGILAEPPGDDEVV